MGDRERKGLRSGKVKETFHMHKKHLTKQCKKPQLEAGLRTRFEKGFESVENCLKRSQDFYCTSKLFKRLNGYKMLLGWLFAWFEVGQDRALAWVQGRATFLR